MLLLIPISADEAYNLMAHLHSTMLLLIRIHARIILKKGRFTFHYASTYTQPSVIHNLTDRNLHSTMLLLILNMPASKDLTKKAFTFHYASTYTINPVIQTQTVNEFTFHYASTYTIPVYGHTATNILFTFHYASTYTYVLTNWCFSACEIYIPLCFYLYHLQCDTRDGTLSDLHSTMLLLIRSCECDKSIVWQYLHSTMLLLIPESTATH